MDAPVKPSHDEEGYQKLLAKPERALSAFVVYKEVGMPPVRKLGSVRMNKVSDSGAEKMSVYTNFCKALGVLIMLVFAVPAAQAQVELCGGVCDDLKGDEGPATLVKDSLKTDLVPVAVNYAVILPPGYKKTDRLPLLMNLHGGSGTRDYVIGLKPMYEKLWAEGALPPMVVVGFTGGSNQKKGQSFYINFKDGSEHWEDFVFALRKHIQDKFNTRPEAAYNYLTGISMGGIGTYRIGLAHPEKFGLIAGMEAGIDPVFEFKDLQPRNYARWHHTRTFTEAEHARMWGWPVDGEFYKTINIVNVARDNAKAIRESGLQIMVEVGDRDFLNFQDGAELLHRIFWENCIDHEYRLVRGADHMGEGVLPRIEDVHRWIGRTARQVMARHQFATGEVSERPDVIVDEGLEKIRANLKGNIGLYADKPFGGPFRGKCGAE